MDILGLLRGLGGLAFVTALAFVFSGNRRKINWRLVIVGIVLQFAFAFLVLQTTIGRDVFFQISRLEGPSRFGVIDNLVFSCFN